MKTWLNSMGWVVALATRQVPLFFKDEQWWQPAPLTSFWAPAVPCADALRLGGCVWCCAIIAWCLWRHWRGQNGRIGRGMRWERLETLEVGAGVWRWRLPLNILYQKNRCLIMQNLPRIYINNKPEI